MAETAARPHVIAERYLTSPAALAARPFGPVDALDTHSGRGAQVRLVFVDGGWDDAALADTVTRWCAIGCSEVCGVLDFGRHDGRWYLVLPPSLGVPVERWRTLRRPASGDAVRLVLAFGRVVERVAAAGFPPDAAALADVAVGPGPTPFLERPLLTEPGRPAPTGDGQRLLAAVCDAALGPAQPPAALAGWRERARGAEFAGLAECLDELERSGAAAAAGGEDDDPAGLDHLFDPGFDLDGPGVAGRPPRGRRVLAWGPAILMVMAAATFLLGHVRPAGRAPAAPAAAARPAPVVPVAAPTAARSPSAGHHHARTHPARRPRRRTHRGARPAAATRTPAKSHVTAAPATQPPATSPQPPATTPAPTATTGGATTLPAPGGTMLPAP
jgi:hypothetical protein